MAVRPPVATVNTGSAATAPATACRSRPASQSRHVPRPPPSVAVLLDIKCRPPASTRHARRRGLAPLFFVRQRAHDVTARFPVALECEHAAPLGFFEQPVERAE